MPIPRFAGEQLSFDPPGYLFFGDNLEVLRRHLPDESVDLVYLDPPFNSNRSFNLLFELKDGTKTAGQQKAFDDSWTWSLQSEKVYEEVVSAGGKPSAMLRGMREIIGASDMLAYITMMTPRLLEMQRVLKSTGSLYLHCDPTASHYLKVMLDAIFDPTNYRNEVIWKRANAHNDPKRFGRISDSILYYGKTDEVIWNAQHTEYREDYYKSHFKRDDEGRYYRTVPLDAPRHGQGSPGLLYEWKGKLPAPTRTWAIKQEKMQEYEAAGLLRYTRTGTPTLLQYADDMPGVPLQNIWNDIPPVNPQARERLGYPTQKPLALLERIIIASSNEGDVVLDPFCGCGTAVEAAQKLGRRWIGIDITKVAIEVIEERMKKQFPDVQYVKGGEPATAEEAVMLAELDKYEFQRWALERIGISNPIKKGADRGIDGDIVGTHANGRTWRAIVSVKGGGISVQHIRDLRGTITREKAEIGVFVTLKPPTAAMKREAVEAGFTKAGHAVMQILTIAEMFDGKKPDLPTKRTQRPRVRRLRLAEQPEQKPAIARSA